MSVIHYLSAGSPSRKYNAAGLCLLTSIVALFTHYLTGSEWIAAISFILGIYTTGNIAEKIKTKPSQTGD
jgi:hypothetical protein